MSSDQAEPSGGSWLVRSVLVMIVWVGLAAAGYYLFTQGNNPGIGPAPVPGTPPVATGPQPTGAQVEIGIAYGTEKQRWLEHAVEEFAKTPAGRSIQVNLIPLGSMEGAHAIIKGDKRIDIWSPASSMYKAVFEQEWAIRNSGEPIAEEEILALSPMVFVMWKDRYDAYLLKYKTVDFKTLSQALQAPGGWGGIATKPEWGLFKFGHTHPIQSNSGLATLVLMAYHHANKTKNLTVADVVEPGFQTWLGETERGMSGMSNSTGNMMKEMVLKGPSAYDGLMVYEAVAIDYLKNAEGRWGQLHIIYPEINMWNDNPYYVLQTAWCSSDQRQAANVFLRFLMSEPIQKSALEHGFRPGDPKVPVLYPESPFTLYAKYGLRVPLSTAVDSPQPEIINNLQQSWQRASQR